MNTLAIALDYIGRGWAPVPIPYRKKGPVLDEWPKLRISAVDAPEYFNGARQNVGVILGGASGNLADVDLDCPEALALADYLLPPSGSQFGRASTPRAHRLFLSALEATLAFDDPDRKADARLLELRASSGHQSVFPGSVHEGGEPVEWYEDGDPAEADPEQLTRAAGLLAAACLLARAAPAAGRHEYLVGISGALVRGLGTEGAAHILAPVARHILGKLYKKAEGARLIADTARKLEAGEPVPGWPRLAELLGERRARRVSDWLGLATQERAAPGVSAGQPWPPPLAPEAYYGIAGDIVRLIEPETEADPAALLFQLLTAAGNILGSAAYAQVESDRHPPRLFTVQVGRTSRGRKGTSWGRVRSLLEIVAPEWTRDRIASGLSSGEGVICEVRDPVTMVTKGKEEVTDPGVTDKRVLVFEGEIARALRAMERPGNTLSAILRDAWDHGNLRTLIKNNPTRATGAHISLIGHVTIDELQRYLDRTEMANGLANRLIFVCVQQSKLLPRGGRPIDWETLERRLRATLAGAPRGEIGRTEAAWAIWESVYPSLAADRPGMLGAILGRAEAQVLRLAVTYALLDKSAFIEADHLMAALACWEYAEVSARFIFGNSVGDPVADEILRVLREQPDGMTRTELFHHFGRNRSSDEIGRALAVLSKGNFVAASVERTSGRPAERWRAVR